METFVAFLCVDGEKPGGLRIVRRVSIRLTCRFFFSFFFFRFFKPPVEVVRDRRPEFEGLESAPSSAKTKRATTKNMAPNGKHFDGVHDTKQQH